MFFRQWILISLLCLCFVAKAQHPYFYQPKETENIVGSEVYSIRQDKAGYIWVAGNEGVFRYDGKQVKQYTCAGQNGKSISDLKEDAHGRMWCKNFNGQIFYIAGDSLKIAVDVSKEYPTFPENAIGDNGVYYTIVGGVAHYDISTNKIQRWYYSAEARRALASNMLYTADGSIYVSVIGQGVHRLQKGKFTKIDKTNLPGLLPRIVQNRNYIFYHGSRLMMFTEINPERDYYLSEIRNDSLIVLKQIPPALAGSRIFTVSAVGKFIWLCTQEGALCVNADLNLQYNGIRFFRDADISNVMRDGENNYWFTSLDNGMYIVPNIDIMLYSQASSGISSDNVTSMYINRKKDILLGYFNGVVDMIRNGKVSQPVKPQQAVSMVRKIIADSTERKYIIAQGITSYYEADKSRTSTIVRGGFRDICFADKGKVLFASIQNAGWIQLHANVIDSTHILKPKAARYVAYTGGDMLKWVGYSDGTYYYDTLNREKELLYNGQKVFATSMKTDSKGHLWIGTVASGLMRVNNARIISNISGTDKLNGNNVRAIYCKDSLVWVATEKGFNVINTNTDNVSYIDWHDGLPNAEIRQIYVTDNTVYLATNKGLITFPANIRTINSIKPNIYLKRLLVNDEEVPVYTHINLPYNQNKLIVYFGTQGFTHKHQYSYSYKMQGLDTVWTESGYNTDYARFTSLPPGDYIFGKNIQR